MIHLTTRKLESGQTRSQGRLILESGPPLLSPLTIVEVLSLSSWRQFVYISERPLAVGRNLERKGLQVGTQQPGHHRPSLSRGLWTTPGLDSLLPPLLLLAHTHGT